MYVCMYVCMYLCVHTVYVVQKVLQRLKQCNKKLQLSWDSILLTIPSFYNLWDNSNSQAGILPRCYHLEEDPHPICRLP
jgi:hypothetical protein